MSRMLGPSTYGALGSLLGLIAVITFGVGALQTAVTQAVAEQPGDSAGSRDPLALRKHTCHAVIGAAVSLCVIAASSPAMERYLHLSSPVPVILLGVFVGLHILILLPQGVLLGQLSFRVVAVSLVVGAVFRLGAGIVLADLGYGLDGALNASVLSAIVTLGVLVWPIRSDIWSTRGSPVTIHFNSTILAVAAVGGFSAAVGVDVFLARHYLGASASGHYAAAATAARIALFLPGAIALIAFPKFAASEGVGAEARRVLVSSLLAVAALGTLAAAVMIAVPHLVISILFGAQYESAVGPLRILSLTAAGLGVISVFVYFHLAKHSKRSLSAWLGVVLAWIVISIWHSSPIAIAWAMFATTGVTLVVIGLRVFPTKPEAEDPSSGYRSVLQRSEAELDLSIVMPYFNPGTALRATVERSINVLNDLGVSFEIIAVSDGSTDGSDDSLVDFSPDIVRCLRLPSNQGKGQALRTGLSTGRGAYLGFIDADGDLPPSLLRAFVQVIAKESPDVVLGSKRHPDSQVIYPPLRRLYSWLYQQLVRTLFRLVIRDTQTGVKLVRRDVLASVLPRMVEKRFAFDLELLVVARQLGYGHIAELPVTIGTRFSSSVKPRAVAKMLLDTCAIFYRSYVLGNYGRRHHRPVMSGGPSFAQDDSAPGPLFLVEEERARAFLDPRPNQRILLFNWRDITHPCAGGAEVYAHEVCKEWVRAGHSVTFFTSQHDGNAESEQLDGIHMVRRGGRFTVYRKARRFYRKDGHGQFDLVVDAVNTRPFSCPQFVKDAPTLAIFHQVAREVWKYESPLPVALIGRYVLEPRWIKLYKNVPVVTVSSSSRESLQSYGLKRVSVVAEGTGFVGAQISPIARESAPTVMFAGRLTPNKRPADAINAFRMFREHCPDAQMWVIGTGRLERRLRRVQVPGVWFLGRVDERVKRERFARAHVVVATSVREGWGLVVTEAAVYGTPTIAYDAPGLRDSVNASGGILVDPKPEALAQELTSRVPAWAAGDMPEVEPGGVIAWEEVAWRILSVALAGSVGDDLVFSQLGHGPANHSATETLDDVGDDRGSERYEELG